jgi:hypothetical protein
MLKNEIIKKYQFKRFASKFKKVLQKKKRTKIIHVILKISEKFYKKQKK